MRANNLGVESGPNGRQPCEEFLRTTTDRVEETHGTYRQDAAGRLVASETAEYEYTDGKRVPTGQRRATRITRAGDSLIAKTVERTREETTVRSVEAYCRDEHGLLEAVRVISDTRWPERAKAEVEFAYAYDERGRPRTMTSVGREPPLPALHLRWDNRNALLEERITSHGNLSSSETVVRYTWDDGTPPRLIRAEAVTTTHANEDASDEMRQLPPDVDTIRWTFERDARGRVIRGTAEYDDSKIEYTLTWDGEVPRSGTRTETLRNGKKIERKRGPRTDEKDLVHARHEAERRTLESWTRFACEQPFLPPPPGQP